MLLGYNTNGLAHHDPLQAIELLADIGYQSVAITLDHGTLNPWAADASRQLDAMRAVLQRRGLKNVIETGARFLLDPQMKHEPTLVSPQPKGRAKRVDFLRRAIDTAAALDSDCVSLWSGVAHDGAGEGQLWERLVAGLTEVLDYAAQRKVKIGFEPEPGMFIDTMDRYAELLARVASPQLGLTLDVGHLHCQGEVPIAEQIRRWAPRLLNVHLEDMRRDVHEHLMFGEGEMDFPPIVAALAEVGYTGGVHVELSRHSHEGPRAAQRAFDFLQPLLPT